MTTERKRIGPRLFEEMRTRAAPTVHSRLIPGGISYVADPLELARVEKMESAYYAEQARLLAADDFKAKAIEGDTRDKLIRALVLALADAKPETLKKDGKPFVGYAKDKNRGIVGHLIEGGFTDLKTSSLETHIVRALKGD